MTLCMAVAKSGRKVVCLFFGLFRVTLVISHHKTFYKIAACISMYLALSCVHSEVIFIERIVRAKGERVASVSVVYL